MMKLNMNLLKRKIPLVTLLVLLMGSVKAQTPSDALMMKPGQICVDVSYNHNSWDEYWEGDSLRENGNIGTLTTHTMSAGFILGIINRVNLLARLPYVVTSPSGGTVEGSKGLQDIALFVKVDALDKQIGKGNLSLLGVAGFSTPISNYYAESPFAIGLDCPEGSFRAIANYKLDMGIYARLQGAYHLRGESFVDQTFYYTTQAYYSNEIDMPDAVDYSVAIGYESKNQQFKAEAEYGVLNTIDGFDIRRQDGGFPSNDMDASRIGVNIDFYTASFLKGFGVHIMSGYTLTGSNVGKSMNIGGALSYTFPLWSKKATETNTTN